MRVGTSAQTVLSVGAEAPTYMCRSSAFNVLKKHNPMGLYYRVWKPAWICGLIVCLGSLPAAPSQEVPELAAKFVSTSGPPPVIRVSSNLVSVAVSVTDAAGHAVRDLGIGDFSVAEDGNPVPLAKMVEASQSPLHLDLLFDLSGSVRSAFEFEQQAAIRFLQKVWKPGDRVSVISFSEQPEVRLRNAELLPEAVEALLHLRPTEAATAFFDTVVFSANLPHPSAGPETRRAAIVLSDGSDNRSDGDLADTLTAVQRSETMVYSINLSGASVRLNEINRKGHENLLALAAATGGTAFLPERSADLDDIFGRIAGELRAQYLLSYYSPGSNPDGRFRRIEIATPAKPHLKIHARQGYYATARPF